MYTCLILQEKVCLNIGQQHCVQGQMKCTNTLAHDVLLSQGCVRSFAGLNPNPVSPGVKGLLGTASSHSQSLGLWQEQTHRTTFM